MLTELRVFTVVIILWSSRVLYHIAWYVGTIITQCLNLEDHGMLNVLSLLLVLK